MVTDGIYGLVRHPQYAGLMLLVIGSLINWPTPITLVMAPILIFMYCRLAQQEEKELEKRFGEVYKHYRDKTPAFFPKLAFIG